MNCCGQSQPIEESPADLNIIDTTQDASKPIKDTSIEYIFKFIIIGNFSVGKTCLLLQFEQGTFNTEYTPTIGVEFGTKVVEINDKTIKLRIWDTAGSERFKCITRGYFRGSHGVIICYDVSDKQSFESIDSWMEELRKYNPINHVLMLVGTKCDVVEKVISTEEGKKKAEEIGALFFECSSKTGENVNKIFMTLAEKVLLQVQLGKMSLEESQF